METDAEHLPDFEGVGQQKQLGFGVHLGANGREGQPGMADFADIGFTSPVALVTNRPCPSLKIPESRGTNHCIVILMDNSEGQSGTGFFPAQCFGDIGASCFNALRDGRPLVEAGVCG